MKKVMQIVDDITYINNNCYQHMLHEILQTSCELTTISLNNLSSIQVNDYDVIISCLKLRTLDKYAQSIYKQIGNKQIRIYDQDPWEAFKDNGPYCGAYSRISSILNVELYAVTVRRWAQYACDRGFPAKFVKIWTMPEYCSAEPTYVNRQISIGFIGSIHPHRKALFDTLADNGINVLIEPNCYSYREFLNRLSQVQIFIHSANMPFFADGELYNLKHGLWAKEIDACSRGCFCLRESDPDSDSFFTPEQVSTARFFESPAHAIDIINDITKIDPLERQLFINSSVDYIRNSKIWQETVNILIN